MILLDTSICIHVITARPQPVLERFRQHRMGDIGVCSVVAAELPYGLAKSGSTRNRQALEMFLAPLVIFPLMRRRYGFMAICWLSWKARAHRLDRWTR